MRGGQLVLLAGDYTTGGLCCVLSRLWCKQVTLSYTHTVAAFAYARADLPISWNLRHSRRRLRDLRFSIHSVRASIGT